MLKKIMIMISMLLMISIVVNATTLSDTTSTFTDDVDLDNNDIVNGGWKADVITDAYIANDLTLTSSAIISGSAIKSGIVVDDYISNTLTLDATSSISGTAINSGTVNDAYIDDTLTIGSGSTVATSLQLLFNVNNSLTSNSSTFWSGFLNPLSFLTVGTFSITDYLGKTINISQEIEVPIIKTKAYYYNTSTGYSENNRIEVYRDNNTIYEDYYFGDD